MKESFNLSSAKQKMAKIKPILKGPLIMFNSYIGSLLTNHWRSKHRKHSSQRRNIFRDRNAAQTLSCCSIRLRSRTPNPLLQSINPLLRSPLWSKINMQTHQVWRWRHLTRKMSTSAYITSAKLHPIIRLYLIQNRIKKLFVVLIHRDNPKSFNKN